MLLSDILEINALKTPNRLALIAEERSFSYSELRDRANRLATALREIAAPGDRVAILSENTVEYVDAYYGVPAAQMTLVFLNYRLNPHELAWILNDAGAKVLIVERAYLDAMLRVRAEWACVQHLVVVGGPAGQPADEPAGALDYDAFVGANRSVVALPGPDEDAPDDDTSNDNSSNEDTPNDNTVAWQLYTSGTTGRPKGALLTHRNLITALFNAIMAYDVKAEDRALLCFPMWDVAGYLVTMNHLVGASVVLMRAYSPELFMELIDRHRITATSLAPTMMTFLLQHPKIDEYALTSLTSIGYGAAAMPVEVLRAAIKRFGPVVWSGFGMTELGGNVLMHPVSAHVRAVNGEDHLLAACGVPMALSAVRVVDENMRELLPGEVGEIVIKGEQLLQGYWNRPEATEEAFRGGWFHTGDMARRDEEGFFYIVDRKKDMIITGAENVYSREVEEILYTHPAVSEAAVIGLPDATWGERVTAVVTLRPGATVSDVELIAHCRSQLAGYKTPKQIEFVSELPKTVSGKILKRELRDRFAGQ